MYNFHKRAFLGFMIFLPKGVLTFLQNQLGTFTCFVFIIGMVVSNWEALSKDCNGGHFQWVCSKSILIYLMHLFSKINIVEAIKTSFICCSSNE